MKYEKIEVKKFTGVDGIFDTFIYVKGESDNGEIRVFPQDENSSYYREYLEETK